MCSIKKTSEAIGVFAGVVIASQVLPLLSKGWGHSLAFVGLGFVAFTAGLCAVLYEVADDWLESGNEVAASPQQVS